MAAGLQCFDASGNLIVDITSRLARIVGAVAVDPTSPARSIVIPAGGSPFYNFQPSFIWGFINMDVSRPNFSLSGSTLSWSWSPGAGTNNKQITGTLFYGIY
jgi:hypothetical protein